MTLSDMEESAILCKNDLRPFLQKYADILQSEKSIRQKFHVQKNQYKISVRSEKTKVVIYLIFSNNTKYSTLIFVYKLIFRFWFLMYLVNKNVIFNIHKRFISATSCLQKRSIRFTFYIHIGSAFSECIMKYIALLSIQTLVSIHI